MHIRNAQFGKVFLLSLNSKLFFLCFLLGHKFAGNVILYTHEGRRGIWYGRVNPCHCEAIVEQTLIEGKVIKDLYRGSMTHSFDDEKTTAEVQW